MQRRGMMKHDLTMTQMASSQTTTRGSITDDRMKTNSLVKEPVAYHVGHTRKHGTNASRPAYGGGFVGHDSSGSEVGAETGAKDGGASGSVERKEVRQTGAGNKVKISAGRKQLR